MFPNFGPSFRRFPFLCRVPAIRFPHFIGTMKALRLLIYHPLCFVSFTPGTGCRLSCSSLPWHSPSRSIIDSGPGLICSPPCPLRRYIHTRNKMSSPRFLGNPFRAYALLSDPGGCIVPGLSVTSCCSRDCYYESSRDSFYFRGSITRLLHPLSTLRASITLTRKTRSRLVATLYRTGISPAGLR